MSPLRLDTLAPRPRGRHSRPAPAWQTWAVRTWRNTSNRLGVDFASATGAGLFLFLAALWVAR